MSLAAILLAAAGDLVPEQRLADIQWPNAAPGRVESAPGQMESRHLDQVRLPVLVPRQASRLRTFRFRGDTNQYSATAMIEGAKIAILGTRHVVIPPRESSAGLASAAPGADFILMEKEGAIDLSFSRFGAAYTISVECYRLSDSRCAKEDFIRSLAEGMVFVGGRP